MPARRGTVRRWPLRSAVGVRVRKLAGFGDEVIGVDLMNRAFGSSGPLTNTSVGKDEQDRARALRRVLRVLALGRRQQAPVSLCHALARGPEALWPS